MMQGSQAALVALQCCIQHCTVDAVLSTFNQILVNRDYCLEIYHQSM